MTISAIIARSSNHVIGRDNQLPWHLPADLKYFKRLTVGHHIVMGRKTYESIGKPLPDRVNIIITRDANYQAAGCTVVHSLDEAITKARQSGDQEVFIIGGAEIFKQSLPELDKLYLTEVHADVEGDVFLPEIGSEWKEISREQHLQDEKHNYDFDFVVYSRG